MICIDGEAKYMSILLTNRVYPMDNATSSLQIHAIRQQVQDAIADHLFSRPVEMFHQQVAGKTQREERNERVSDCSCTALAMGRDELAACRASTACKRERSHENGDALLHQPHRGG